MKKASIIAALAVALTLGACEFAQNAVAPSISGQPAGIQTATPAAGATGQPVSYGQQPGVPTGTLVGERVVALRADLGRLQQAVAEQTQRREQLRANAETNAATYQTTVAAIHDTLRAGATPASAGLTEAYQRAQTQLQLSGADLDQMNALSSSAANNAAFAGYLLDSIRACYAIAGAVEEDHRALNILEDATAQTMITINRLLSDLGSDIARQNYFVGREHATLAQLAQAVNGGDYSGATLASGTMAHAAQPSSAPGAGLATGRPLVIIRFDRDDVQYEQALYEAMSAALQRRPNVAFDLVAVGSAIGTPAQVAASSEIARANADKVMHSLLNMGLPADRVSLSQVTDPNIQSSEVHLYVR